MCNLYSMTKNRDAIGRLFRVSDNRLGVFETKDAIFPGYKAPVVRLAPDGERELVEMNWGFILLQTAKAPRRVTNTRSDKTSSKFWRPSLETRRCLVPATAYCEPQGDAQPPVPWAWFALKGEDERPLFSFAGLWRTWNGPIKKDGPNVEIDVYSFMTTEPNELTSAVNHDRSPVVLGTDDARDTWLNGSLDEALTLVQPYPAEAMRMVQFGKDKRDLQLAA